MSMSVPSIVLASVAWIALAPAPVALAQVDEAAKEVLLQSRAALAQSPGMAYKGKVAGEGSLAGLLEIEGDARVIRVPGSDARATPIWVKGKSKIVGDDPANFEVGFDGTWVTWIDEKSKTVLEQRRRRRAPSDSAMNIANYLVPEEFRIVDPFLREMDAPSLRIDGLAEVRGEPCEIVRAEWPEQSEVRVWAISVTDRIPRRLEQRKGSADKPIVIVSEFWEMNPAAELTMDDLKVEVPSGFGFESQKNQQAPTPRNIPVGPQVGADAPAFELPTPAGDNVSLESMRGKVTVLAFWRPGLSASAEAVKGVGELAREFGADGVTPVAIACRAGDPAEAARAFAEAGANYTLLVGGDDVAGAYNVLGFPSIVVIDAQGKVAGFAQSYDSEKSPEQIRGFIRAALEK